MEDAARRMSNDPTHGSGHGPHGPHEPYGSHGSHAPEERPIRNDPGQSSRPMRSIRSDTHSRRAHLAGEYGEGAPDAADARLRELIRERLTEDPDIDASNVIIDVADAQVRLSGSVRDARTRDIIEQCVENCGAKTVRNELSVS